MKPCGRRRRRVAERKSPVAEEEDLWQKERAMWSNTRHVAERMRLIGIMWQKKGPCVAERKRPVPEEMDLWQKETDLVAEEKTCGREDCGFARGLWLDQRGLWLFTWTLA